MDFAFSEEQELLRRTARAFLDEHSPIAAVRRAMERPSANDAALWGRMAALGWQGMAVPEEYGGAGFGILELAVIAEELGRALAPIPFSSSVYLATQAILITGNTDQKKRALPGLASGELIGTLAFAGDGVIESGGTITGAVVPVPDGELADLAVLVLDGRMVLVDLRASGVTRDPVRSIDPTRSLARIQFDGVHAEPVRGDVDDVLDRAAVLFAFEQLGGAQRCLEKATDYAKSRFAFGRPIGSFQAIKHRLADVYVAVEQARSNCYYGAWAAANDAPELAEAACLARLAASQAYRFAAEENVQVHGGIGFTWECDAHMFVKRAITLELALGSPHGWRERLVQQITA